ncbi:conserved hypothetical protein [Burkholderia vietnamiensis G4]|jgi:predicted nuclease of restriction endonuclease-like (RecB) superfamily|uniref:Uncharacterized protein n=2 Tax=Burkholderia cepacia complex TaxID=87882 RepID=A4JQF3_BURVG|nr:conserved hypothetical protein [Burkholderia vietnamiensis G4]
MPNASHASRIDTPRLATASLAISRRVDGLSLFLLAPPRRSSRQLQERMQSMLFERSALSRQPDEVIRREVAHLRDAQQMTPDLVLKDPYILDFLGLDDRYLERDLEELNEP